MKFQDALGETKIQEFNDELKACKTYEEFQKLIAKMEAINNNPKDCLIWFMTKRKNNEPFAFTQKIVFGNSIESVEYLISNGRTGICKIKNLYRVIKVVEN